MMLLEVIVDGKQHLHETPLLTNVPYSLHNSHLKCRRGSSNPGGVCRTTESAMRPQPSHARLFTCSVARRPVPRASSRRYTKYQDGRKPRKDNSLPKSTQLDYLLS